MARIRSGLGNRVSEFYVFSSGGSQGEMTCGEVVPGEGGGYILHICHCSDNCCSQISESVRYVSVSR